MRNVKLALFYLLIVLAVSCGTKKKSVHVSTQKSDTLIVKTETIKAPVINDVMTIRDICKDSTITEFQRVFIRDTDTVTIESVDGSLLVRISQQERTLSERETTIQKQKEQLEHYEELIKRRPDLRTTLILIGVIVLLWLVPGIPSRINRFVRKLFGSPL